ncbi:hypothetical protein J6590_011330 [Homalodisca vitripennis]|nr:hypothetical protein J6590_011330 [Homalodisca vitripennis]
MTPRKPISALYVQKPFEQRYRFAVPPNTGSIERFFTENSFTTSPGVRCQQYWAYCLRSIMSSYLRLCAKPSKQDQS